MSIGVPIARRPGRTTVERACELCGRPVRVQRSRWLAGRGRYCSLVCSAAGARRTREDLGPELGHVPAGPRAIAPPPGFIPLPIIRLYGRPLGRVRGACPCCGARSFKLERDGSAFTRAWYLACLLCSRYVLEVRP